MSKPGKPIPSAALAVVLSGVALIFGGQPLASAERAAMAVPANTGNPPGGPFHVDLRQGYDALKHYLGDYTMDTGHNGTVYDPAMIAFSDGGMVLNLEKRKTRGVPFRGSEFHVSGFYGYGRYEVVMRPAKGSGVVSSFFTHTYKAFGDPHDEIDFEFLGKDTRRVELNYFTNGKSWGGKIVNLGFDYTEGFHLYAFEWEADAIRWFVDGKLIHEVKAADTKTPLPRASGRVIANIWAGRGDTQGWTGPATTDKASAAYLCMSHVPLGGSGRQCSDAR